MTGHSASPDGTAWVVQAAYAYDGARDRLQQVDYTSGSAITTTYSNDALGLTQVLAADDGTEQVYNLFGLDLIAQDDGMETRTLLADGLGSARMEMVGPAVETVTTYSLYGKLLAQTGSDGPIAGATYSFTGEQHDGATGLLYLRARYYSPYIYHFQSRDPYPGAARMPASQNGYSYVHGNPVNYTDPSGFCRVRGERFSPDYMPHEDSLCWAKVHTIENMWNPWWDQRWGSLDNFLTIIAPQETLGTEFFVSEINRYYNSIYYKNLDQAPPLPRGSNDTWDGISAYISITPGTQGLQANGEVGIELLHNFETGDQTLFVVIGMSGGVGVGETVEIVISQVYNIDDDNLAYQGDFNSLNDGFAVGFGLSGGYAWVPDDRNPYQIGGRQGDPYSISTGCALGLGGNLSIGTVEYIPIYTVNPRTGAPPEWHTYDYLFNLEYGGNGQITQLTKDLSTTILNYLERENYGD